MLGLALGATVEQRCCRQRDGNCCACRDRRLVLCEREEMALCRWQGRSECREFRTVVHLGNRSGLYTIARTILRNVAVPRVEQPVGNVRSSPIDSVWNSRFEVEVQSLRLQGLANWARMARPSAACACVANFNRPIRCVSPLSRLVRDAFTHGGQWVPAFLGRAKRRHSSNGYGDDAEDVETPSDRMLRYPVPTSRRSQRPRMPPQS